MPEEPEVIVDFEFEDGLLFVAVRNIGARPAYRVSTRFDKPFRGLQGTREISSLRLFRNIEFLAPGAWDSRPRRHERRVLPAPRAEPADRDRRLQDGRRPAARARDQARPRHLPGARLRDTGGARLMATKRDDPYRNFNFLVDLGTGDPARFAEVLLPEGSIAAVEYREGGDRTNAARKLPGRAEFGNAILHRGFTGDLGLYTWWNEIRNGAQDFRTVRIELESEDRQVVAAWILHRAWPARIAFGPLRGLGDEVFVETLELALDSFEIA